MKYRVRKGHQLLYPDGTPRGGRGYVVDGDCPHERGTLLGQSAALEQISERQAVPSVRDLDRLAGESEPVTSAPAPKKAKAKRKKTSILKRIKGED